MLTKSGYIARVKNKSRYIILVSLICAVAALRVVLCVVLGSCSAHQQTRELGRQRLERQSSQTFASRQERFAHVPLLCSLGTIRCSGRSHSTCRTSGSHSR